MIGGLFYRFRNFLENRIRELTEGHVIEVQSGEGLIRMSGILTGTVVRCRCGDPDSHAGSVCPKGQTASLGILGKRVVTTAGVNYMRDDFNAATGGADITNFNYHDAGTGVVAEAIGDTTLGTPWGGSRVAGTQSAPSSKVYRTVATISFTGSFAITEHGIFSASTSGTLWDRTVFTAINVNNGDSIQFQYDLTINDGG